MRSFPFVQTSVFTDDRYAFSGNQLATFWDYQLRGSVERNLGWRLDHIMVTEPLAKKSTACYIDKNPRLAERPSDHTPIVAEFDW